MIKTKRAYDAPEAQDGYRILVDRLWPRGMKKEALQLDAWSKELGPSDELRQWFGHEPSRFVEFAAKYRRELARPALRAELADLVHRARLGTVTLVYSARDQEHNNAVVIQQEIARQLGESTANRAGRSARRPGGASRAGRKAA